MSSEPKSPRATVDAYVKALPAEQGAVVRALIDLVREAAPNARLSIKWAQPVFEQEGPFCYVRAFSKHVNLGFWRGASLKRGKGVLESGGQKMAHVKIRSAADIRKELFRELVREAVRLNQSQGDPTKRRSD